MPTKPVIVQYRKLHSSSRSSLGNSLQQAIQSAMNHLVSGTRLRDDWNLRAEQLPANDLRFANNYSPTRANVFGTLLLFEPNALQALLSNMGHVPDVAVGQLHPAPGRQYLKGILYWLVVQDHVFVVQSVSLRAQALEQYLEWLLRKAGILPQAAPLELISEFDRQAVGSDIDVRTVAVHGRILSPARLDQMESDEKVTAEVERTKSLAAQRGTPITKARALELLRALFPGGSRADTLYNQIPDDGQLDYNFELMLRTRDIEARKRFNRELQRDLRDAEDGQVRAVGPDGKLSGDDIRLQMIIPVETVGSLLDIESARSQMLLVYKRFIEDNKIQL